MTFKFVVCLTMVGTFGSEYIKGSGRHDHTHDNHLLYGCVLLNEHYHTLLTLVSTITSAAISK